MRNPAVVLYKEPNGDFTYTFASECDELTGHTYVKEITPRNARFFNPGMDAGEVGFSVHLFDEVPCYQGFVAALDAVKRDEVMWRGFINLEPGLHAILIFSYQSGDQKWHKHPTKKI